MSERLRVEFHCHTIYSKDSLTRPEQLVQACRQKGINRVVVTDHNTISGGLRAREIDPERVIVGEEIMTRQGELLAFFVQEEVPKGLDCMEAIRLLRAQQAFISVSHPFDVLRGGHWELEDLLKITPLVDAIEVFNARCYRAAFNRQAQDFAQEHDLDGTVGSDAHALYELGKATLLLPAFEDAVGLKVALKEARAELNLLPVWTHLSSRYAVLRKKLGGLDEYRSTP
jgi:predicted metal-dependent phosphoesterase TrpH